jgi:hypothetical protein
VLFWLQGELHYAKARSRKPDTKELVLRDFEIEIVLALRPLLDVLEQDLVNGFVFFESVGY